MVIMNNDDEARQSFGRASIINMMDQFNSGNSDSLRRSFTGDYVNSASYHRSNALDGLRIMGNKAPTSETV